MFKINIHKTYLGGLLFLITSISIFEAHYLLYLGTGMVYYAKASKKTADVCSFLILIVIIGAFSAFFNNVTLQDWLKDFAYLTKPIIAILAGFLISKKINNLKNIIRVIILISSLFAVYHILLILFKADFSSFSVSYFRSIGGISNEIESFAIVLLLASWRVKEINVVKNTFYKKILLSVLLLSFCLYFSRTMVVSIVILLMAAFGYLRLTAKGLKYISFTLLFFGLFYIYLFNADINRGQPGFESFLYKMKIAPSEIFSPPKSIDTKNHSNLWDSWRAYEAKMAINQVDTFGGFVFGKGLGALVDLKFFAPLGGEQIRFIPILHNGYINIFLKSGFIGVLLYIMLLVYLYLTKTKNKNKQMRFTCNVVSGLAVHYLFTSLIVTGIYNLSESYAFILGVFLYHTTKENEGSQQKKKQQQV